MDDTGVTLRKPECIAQVVGGRVREDNNFVNDQTYQFGYNSQGMVTNYIDPLGRQTVFDYYPNGLDLQGVRQTMGLYVWAHYWSYWFLYWDEPIDFGFYTNNDVLAGFGAYNAQHRPSTYTNSACQVYSLQWNSRGQLTGVTNPKGESVALNYNANSYLQNIQQPWSGGTKTTSLGYDGFGRVNGVTDSDNYVLNYAYDDFDRLTKVTYPDQTFEQYLYDRLDLVRARDRSGKTTQITYDALSRPLSVVDRLGQTNLFSWCGCGGLDSITDPLGHFTSWVRDLEGRVTEKYYFDGTVTHFGYGTNCSWLLSVTNADNSVKHYGYAIDESLTNVTYTGAVVAMPPVTFGYDPNYPRLTSMADGTGTTTFGYYYPVSAPGQLGAGRLASTTNTFTKSSITYQYDELNRLTSRAINGINESVAYDDLGRISSHTSVLGAFVPAYVNATRRLSSLAYPNGQTTVFDYFDNAGDKRLKEIWNKTGSSATMSKFGYGYDVLGRIMQWTNQVDANTPNVMTMDNDAEDQLLNAAITPQGQSIAKAFSYGYDVAANRTREQIETAGAGYSATGSAYNDVNQLTGRSLGPVTFRGTVNQPAEVRVISGANGVAARMTQDPNSASNGKIFTAALNLPVGNDTVTVVATNFAQPTSFETTKNYQLTVVDVPAKAFAYDANGNLTNEVTATTTNSYAWDAENQLVKITLLTNNTTFTSEFTYDGFGRRAQIVEKNNGATTSTKKFVWLGAQLAEERDSNNNVTKRFLAEGEQVGSQSYYFTKDHLGSIREMTDDTGAIRARYDYDPYGRRTKIQGNLDADFGFTGYYVHQPSGLQLALYRAYDADLGRFINRDPIEEDGGLNLYEYTANNPINWSDRTGLQPQFDEFDFKTPEFNNNEDKYIPGNGRNLGVTKIRNIPDYDNPFEDNDDPIDWLLRRKPTPEQEKWYRQYHMGPTPKIPQLIPGMPKWHPPEKRPKSNCNGNNWQPIIIPPNKTWTIIGS